MKAFVVMSRDTNGHDAPVGVAETIDEASDMVRSFVRMDTSCNERFGAGRDYSAQMRRRFAYFIEEVGA